MFKKMKQKCAQFLETIAKQNQKQFGSQRMECCDLNKKKKTKTARK